jgi:hypothetical protein
VEGSYLQSLHDIKANLITAGPTPEPLKMISKSDEKLNVVGKQKNGGW